VLIKSSESVLQSNDYKSVYVAIWNICVQHGSR